MCFFVVKYFSLSSSLPFFCCNLLVQQLTLIFLCFLKIYDQWLGSLSYWNSEISFVTIRRMKQMSMAKFVDSYLDNFGILSEGVAWKSLNSASERLEWPTGITRWKVNATIFNLILDCTLHNRDLGFIIDALIFFIFGYLFLGKVMGFTITVVSQHQLYHNCPITFSDILNFYLAFCIDHMTCNLMFKLWTSEILLW